MLVDLESNELAGLSNNTLIDLINDIETDSSGNNLTIKTELITSYEKFESQIEDDPKNCKSFII